MNRITQVTDSARQKQSLKLPDGSSFTIEIRFSSMQYGWYITKLSYEGFEINNLRIVNSPNILHQFKNRIPFGIACYSENDREPMLKEDFSSGASKLYLLTASETDQFEEYLLGG